MLSLNDYTSVEGLESLTRIDTLYREFFYQYVYDWWYYVQPGDVVVDVGACVGFFTCLALDRGASKVYSIEPNPKLINTILKNTMPHTVNKINNPLVIINKAIGTDNYYLNNIHGPVIEKEAINLITFKELIDLYNIDRIDYLKIDCEGGEYNILTPENLDYIKNNVKHITVEVHIDAFENAPKLFMDFRNNFLSRFKKEQIRFYNNSITDYEKTFNVDWLSCDWPVGWGSSWLIYISNFENIGS